MASLNQGYKKTLDKVLVVVTVLLAIFHLYSASIGVMPSFQQSAIHWGFVGAYIILSKPLKFKGGTIIDWILILLNTFICYYQIKLQYQFIMTAGIYSKSDIWVSILAIVVVTIIAYRSIGSILPIIAGIFLLYSLYGYMMPGGLKTSKFTLQRIAPYLFTSSDGFFGQTLYVSAQFIYLFVLFGSILNLTGAGKFFVDISFALTGRVKGGPAQAAVFSSMLMGTINGSGAANVVTTGTFTIPLMKKVGFKPAFAGAVETVASSGGQILPPVMGAVAFLMAEMTGIPYSKIAVAAALPAILYFITLAVSVYLQANKRGIEADKDKILNAKEIMKDGWIYLVPLVVLIYTLLSGFSAQKAGFYGILSSLAVGFIKNRSEMTFENFGKAFKEAAGGIAPIAAACILAGVVMGVLNMTGLGLKVSSLIVSVANGNLIIALVLAMVTSLILGMGLPTSAAYMVLAILVAPALVKLGVTEMGAHLFILYFGALSTITPPVALSTFAAAGIAGSGLWETGWEAIKLAATGFVIPFIFCISPELLLIGNSFDIAIGIITALIGSVVFAVAINGWFFKMLNKLYRLILGVAALMLFVANPLLSVIGLVISLVTLGFIFITEKKQKNTLTTN